MFTAGSNYQETQNTDMMRLTKCGGEQHETDRQQTDLVLVNEVHQLFLEELAEQIHCRLTSFLHRHQFCVVLGSHRVCHRCAHVHLDHHQYIQHTHSSTHRHGQTTGVTTH